MEVTRFKRMSMDFGYSFSHIREPERGGDISLLRAEEGDRNRDKEKCPARRRRRSRSRSTILSGAFRRPSLYHAHP